MSLRLLLFTIILFNISCGKLDDFLDYEPRSPDYYYTYETFDSYASTFTTRCDDSTDCSDFTGTLLTQASAYQIGSCTAFLIASDTILTNAHCIPNSLKSNNPRSCYGSIVFLLPANNRYRAERFNCRSIEYNSKPNITGESFAFEPDYATIKLHGRSIRNFATISNQGLNVVDTYSVYKSDNNMDNKNSIIRKIECKIKDSANNSLILTQKKSINALNCDVIKGNSGSPVVSTSQDVVGIVYGGSTSPSFISTYITNFMCLEYSPVSSYAKHNSCD